MTEVAELTARLVADVATFNQNMESADATVAQAREQVKALEGDLATLKTALETVGSGALGGIRDDTAQADAAMKSLRDSALEAGTAARNISTDSAANARAELLAQEYDGIRDTLIEIRAIQADSGASDVTIAKTDVQVASVTTLRDRWIEAAAAAKGAGPTDVEIAKQALMAAEATKTRDALIEAAAAQEVAGGGGRSVASVAGDGSNDGGLLAGILPGGRRARPAALLTLAGLGLATGPVVAPAAVGAGAAAAAGLSSLVGAALTLKLAFADITSAAFTSQKAFDALTPVQQDFVQGLRNIDYQFVRPLEELASQNVLPGLTAALKDAITPASTVVARQGVAGFGSAIGGGAQQLGSLFGSDSFLKELGPVLQADSGYVRDFFGGITNLADAFVTLENAAIPLTNWMDRGVLAFTQYLDVSIKSAQSTGALVGYFGRAQVALESLGGLVRSVGDAFGAFFGAVGFENSLGVIQTFKDAFNGLAAIINQNKTILRDFFAGAISSAQDVISLVRGLSDAISPLLSVVNDVVRVFGGWRAVIDGLIAYKLASVLLEWAVGFTAVGAASGTALAEVTGLRAALLATGAADVLASLTAVLGPLALIAAAAYGAASGAQALSGWLGRTSIGGALGLGDTPLPKGVSFSDIERVTTEVKGGKKLNARDQQIAAYLAGGAPPPAASNTTAAGAAGAGSGNIAALPPNLQESLAQVANETGAKQQKDQAAVYAAIRSYYDILLGVTYNQSQRTAILNARAGYVSAGTTPPPLGNTRTTVLPTALQTALDAATSNVAAGGPKGPEEQALNNAIAYINSLKKKTDADYQERTTLYNQLASLKKAGVSTATPTGLGVLPPGLQGSLAAAQTAAAAQSPVAGTFSAADLSAQRALRAQDLDALKQISTEIAKQAAGSKELRALEAERLTLTRERNDAEKSITEELKSQKQAAASARIDQILGTSSAGPTSPGATALGSRERQILLEDAKRHGIQTQPLINEPLAQLVKTLAGDNAIPSSSQAALIKVNNAIHESIVTGTKLNSTQSQEIQALLTQINDTLQNSLGYGSNYRVPSVTKLAESIPGYDDLTKEQKIAVKAALAAKVVHGGTIQTGGAVGGVPLGSNGEPLTTAPGYTATTIPGAPPLAVSHSQFGSGVTTFGDVYISIDAAGKDPKQIAAEVRNELLKTARRNATQTKGPNAGRRLGMN